MTRLRFKTVRSSRLWWTRWGARLPKGRFSGGFSLPLVRLAVFGESQNEEGTPVQVRDSTSCCEACTGFEQGATVGVGQRPNGKAFEMGQVRRPAAIARVPGFLDQKPRIT
jgi:hypothetical protein